MPIPSYQNASRFAAWPWRLVVTPSRLRGMARTYLVFGDIEGKLEVLRVECTRCDRKGRYSVHSTSMASSRCSVSNALGETAKGATAWRR